MQTFNLTGDYQQVAAPGAVVIQAKGGGGVTVRVDAAQPAPSDEGFELLPENENIFASEVAVPVWARSDSSSARVVVMQDGA